MTGASLPPVAPMPGVPSIHAEYFLYSFGDRNVSMNPNKIIISLQIKLNLGKKRAFKVQKSEHYDCGLCLHLFR